jgi:hypothetical protein
VWRDTTLLSFRRRLTLAESAGTVPIKAELQSAKICNLQNIEVPSTATVALVVRLEPINANML